MRSKPPTIGMENQLLQLHMANAAAFCAMFRQEPIGYGKWGEWHNCSPFLMVFASRLGNDGAFSGAN